MTLPLVRNTTSIHRLPTYMYIRVASRRFSRPIRLGATSPEYRMRFLTAACNLRKEGEREGDDDLPRVVHYSTPVSRHSPLFLPQRLIFPSVLSPRLVRIVRTLPGKHSQTVITINEARSEGEIVEENAWDSPLIVAYPGGE